MMHLLRPSTPAYVCASCTHRLLTTAKLPYLRNGSPLAARSIATAPRRISAQSRPRTSIAPRTSTATYLHHNAYYSTATTSRKPLRLAIIGSGPAGFYTAHRLMKKVPDAVVDMYEQLPVPYGLVRFGVAPDHPEVKNCQDTFEEVALSPRFNYIGNVCVGQDVALKDMKPHYDAMLFSYGASEDKKLEIPGENLPGVYSAREFVGWYNGLPQFQGLKPQLQAGEEAVIVGHGNVALDVARILLTPVDTLSTTDITEEALQTLSESKVKSVRVVGRRGPIQASFSVKEIRELMNIPTVAFEPFPRDLYPKNLKQLPRVPARIGEVLVKGTPPGRPGILKTWALDFLKAPISINAENDRVSSVTFIEQEIPFKQRWYPFAKPYPTDIEDTMDASVVFRSIGYKATPLSGLSRDLGVKFDNKVGIIPNDVHGRVISPERGPGNLTAGHVPGMYCAGWVKRGPTGVIASTMEDAFASADIIAQDWEANVPFMNTEGGESMSTHLGWDGIKDEVIAKGVQPLSWKDWKVIDAAERERGKKLRKEREKFGTVKEMLQVLNE